MRWPDPWPGNYLMAMRAATFTSRAGRGHEFATCALRAAFQQGHDLSIIPERVLEAARNAGLDQYEVDEATRDPQSAVTRARAKPSCPLAPTVWIAVALIKPPPTPAASIS